MENDLFPADFADSRRKDLRKSAKSAGEKITNSPKPHFV